MGTIITGLFVAFIACLFDLESLANAISLGTLQVFSFVNAGVILLRMRSQFPDDPADGELSPLVVMPKSPLATDPAADAVARHLGLRKETSIEIRKSLPSSSTYLNPRLSDLKPIWYVSSFSLAALLMSVSISRGWGVWIVTFCVGAMGTFTLLLYSLPQSRPQHSFACPMVPAIPLLGILSNCYMMGAMSSDTWILIAGWLFLGLLFYFGYGIHNSKLRTQSEQRSSSRTVAPTQSGNLLPPLKSATWVQSYEAVKT
jgi:C-terminus of AA_permease